MMSIPLQVSHIYKSFDGVPLLRDVSFDVAPREVLCLLGPSGCGKTTLLNIIAGLEQPESGQVLVEGQDISSVPVHQRGFGLMFQDLALFPHKNVRDNVAFGLRMANLAPHAIEAHVREALELVGLGGFGQRDVNQLSGGEQQRVALARSLAPRPRLLMLDEPLSSLDRALRERLMNELRDILTRVGQTAIYVTHDQQEAFALADRVVILSPGQEGNAGRVVQIGAPQEVYRHPADAFVARFLGLTNLVRGQMSEVGGRRQVQTTLGVLALPEGACYEGQVTVLIRPDAARLDPKGLPDPSGLVVDGELVERSFRGERTRIVVRANETPLEFQVDSTETLPPVGAQIRLALRSEAITCLPAS